MDEVTQIRTSRTRICLSCGMPTTNGSRCLPCAGRYRNATRNPAYDDPAYRRLRTPTTCPGYGVPAHAATDLTLDHVIPLSRGGAVLGPTRVLCRGCNTRKMHADRPQRGKPKPR